MNIQNIYCTQCGAPNRPTDKFCGRCGSELPEIVIEPAQEPPQDEGAEHAWQGQAEEPWAPQFDAQEVREAAFIGANVLYYVLNFKRLRSLNTTNSWNWSAFFFGSFWLLYRKMYAVFGLTYAINVAFNLIFSPAASGFGMAYSLAVGALFGLFGNYLYMKHVERHLKKADALGETALAIIFAARVASAWAR